MTTDLRGLQEDCGCCSGNGWGGMSGAIARCPFCRGSGKAWRNELIEESGRAIYEHTKVKVREVVDEKPDAEYEADWPAWELLTREERSIHRGEAIAVLNAMESFSTKRSAGWPVTTDRGRVLRIQRMVADRVTDEMLTKPVGELTNAETAILRAALKGAYSDEIMRRIKALGVARDD